MSDREMRAWVALDRAQHELTFAEVAKRAKLKNEWDAGCTLRRLEAQGRASSRAAEINGDVQLLWRAL